jgi:hypothetical protein
VVGAGLGLAGKCSPEMLTGSAHRCEFGEHEPRMGKATGHIEDEVGMDCNFSSGRLGSLEQKMESEWDGYRMVDL